MTYRPLSTQDKIVVGFAIAGPFILILFFGCGGMALWLTKEVKKELDNEKPKAPMELPAYKAQRPKEGARLTGECHIFQNSDEINMLGIQIDAGGKTEAAFCPKDSRVGSDLLKSLGDGKTHTITVDVIPYRYEANSGMVDGSRIMRVVKD